MYHLREVEPRNLSTQPKQENDRILCQELVAVVSMETHDSRQTRLLWLIQLEHFVLLHKIALASLSQEALVNNRDLSETEQKLREL